MEKMSKPELRLTDEAANIGASDAIRRLIALSRHLDDAGGYPSPRRDRILQPSPTSASGSNSAFDHLSRAPEDPILGVFHFFFAFSFPLQLLDWIDFKYLYICRIPIPMLPVRFPIPFCLIVLIGLLFGFSLRFEDWAYLIVLVLVDKIDIHEFLELTFLFVQTGYCRL